MLSIVLSPLQDVCPGGEAIIQRVDPLTSKKHVRSQLSICTFLPSEQLAQSLVPFLSGERYVLSEFQSKEAFLSFVTQRQQQIDCLILEDVPEMLTVVEQLYEQGTLLPSVILKADIEEVRLSPTSGDEIRKSTLPAEKSGKTSAEFTPEGIVSFYDAAAIEVSISEMDRIADRIEQAIARFLELSSQAPLCETFLWGENIAKQNFLLSQQQRLAEKLRERLGYLGVYYKRNPKHFFRNFSASKKQEFLAQLKYEYRQIVLNYFVQDANLNQKIDEFVNTAFFSDIPVTHIVEIHMELMDDLSKQLKLEGRNDEVLLDYRLTLIDVIAHLCEMYRRSLPRES